MVPARGRAHGRAVWDRVPVVPEKHSLEGARSMAVMGGAEMLMGGSAVSCPPEALAHLGFLSAGG